MLNWLLARRAAGRFVLRSRIGEAEATIDDLRWLGLDWDRAEGENPQESAYEHHCALLLAAGRAYHTFETAEELEQTRRQAIEQGRPYRYVRPQPLPDEADVRRARAQGRPVVLRFRMPDKDISFEDPILGPVTIRGEEHEDFILLRADGQPTPDLANPIDDARTGVTHVLQGQECLVSAARQIALQEALGLAPPIYAHLPMLLNPDGTRLGGRDRQLDEQAGRPPRPIDVRDFRAAGYLPEVLLGFLGRLGRSSGYDQDLLDREDLLREFDIRQIRRTAPRFDRQKLLSLNAQALAGASEDRRLAGLRDCLSVRDTGVNAADDNTLRRLLRLEGRWRTFGELEEKWRALFVADEQVVYDERAIRKVLLRGSPRGCELLEQIRPQLEALDSWQPESIEQVIQAFRSQTQLAPARVIQPIQVAVAGRVTGLPIGGMLDVLGQARTLRRIERCLTMCEAM